MDVLTGFAATLRDDGEQDCKVQLLEHLGAKRRKGARKLHGVVANNSNGLRRELKRLSKDLDRTLRQDGSKRGDPKAASAQAAAAALRLESELADTSRLGRQNLHPYRLKVKELRNVLRLAKDPGDKEFVDTLGEVKDAIGEWHDWQELAAIAQKVLGHGPGCNLIRQLKQTTEKKYESALQSAEQMRKQYLAVGRGKRATGVRRASKPVWTATSAMAA
jgi:CHAD domain-containing protein